MFIPEVMLKVTYTIQSMSTLCLFTDTLVLTLFNVFTLYNSTVLPTFTLLAVPAVPFLTGTLPEGRQVGTVGSCFVAVMGVLFTFIDI